MAKLRKRSMKKSRSKSKCPYGRKKSMRKGCKKKSGPKRKRSRKRSMKKRSRKRSTRKRSRKRSMKKRSRKRSMKKKYKKQYGYRAISDIYYGLNTTDYAKQLLKELNESGVGYWPTMPAGYNLVDFTIASELGPCALGDCGLFTDYYNLGIGNRLLDIKPDGKINTNIKAKIGDYLEQIRQASEFGKYPEFSEILRIISKTLDGKVSDKDLEFVYSKYSGIGIDLDDRLDLLDYARVYQLNDLLNGNNTSNLLAPLVWKETDESKKALDKVFREMMSYLANFAIDIEVMLQLDRIRMIMTGETSMLPILSYAGLPSSGLFGRTTPISSIDSLFYSPYMPSFGNELGFKNLTFLELLDRQVMAMLDSKDLQAELTRELLDDMVLTTLGGSLDILKSERAALNAKGELSKEEEEKIEKEIENSIKIITELLDDKEEKKKGRKADLSLTAYKNAQKGIKVKPKED